MVIHAHTWRTTRYRAVGVALALLVIGCGATRLDRAWVSPEVRAVSLNRVVAIALTSNPARRRAMEASIAEEIREAAPDVNVTESSTLINDSDIRDEAKVRERLDGAGFDAQMVMRITDVARNDVYVPGRAVRVPPYYRTFWGYYRYWAPIAYEPGYVEHDRDVQVETELYSTGGDGQLLYSAVSHTLNPSSAGDLANDVTGVVARDLKKRNLLK